MERKAFSITKVNYPYLSMAELKLISINEKSLTAVPTIASAAAAG